MLEQDLQNLKNDPKFIENLEMLTKEAKELQSVQKAYQVLDASLVLERENDTIDSLFGDVLQISFDDLAQKLANGEKFDINSDEDLARLRAIYEHGIEKYSSDDYKGAKEIFLVLHYMLEGSGLEEALKVHIVAAAKEIDFDEFFENYTDAHAIATDESRYAHFIGHFCINVEQFLRTNSEVLNSALAEIDSLKG